MTTTQHTALLESALCYAARGWRVIPLHDLAQGHCSCAKGPDCDKYAGKHPRFLDWTTEGSTQPDQLRAWWQAFPLANIGIITGLTSGIVVVDVDPRNGGSITLETLWDTHGRFPDTPMVLSGGGGQHYYFATTDAMPSFDPGPGINVLADGGHQVVAPPSLHMSGARYTWEASSDPDDVPLAPLPDWIRTAAQTYANRIPAEGVTLPDTLPAVTIADLRVNARTKYIIRTGESPDTPYPSRSEAVNAVVHALIDGQHDDATIAAVLTTAHWGISAKPLGQKNAKSPRYREETLRWVSGEIARARAKHQAPSRAEATRPAPMLSPPADDAKAVSALLYSLRFPFVDTAPHVPALPRRAHCEVSTRTTWLDHYAEHSAYWANRAAPSYHEAVGLWVLSTIAARRIVVQMGSTPVYPTLFLALVSESTHWTKTTAAEIGKRLLDRAGCGHLLAPDRTTPQFLLKLMSGLVPQNYGTLDEMAQLLARETLGFAAQRGWFYEEWGTMLTQMRRVDSPHAELNKLLIVLEGGAETFETGTIQRGLERIKAPYLALLGNATPHDMAPFMGEGNPWWHDGFWPRFVCITPPYGAKPSRTHRPREAYHLPGDLITPLNEWHKRLGFPRVTVEEERESNGKLTGRWVSTVSPLPCQHLMLTSDVYDAYETYNDALLEMIHDGNVQSDLSPWYGRAHEKALRVAMLLASVHGEKVITRDYWSKGQGMVESWRKNLHEVLATISTAAPLSREAQLEARIESLCAKTGGLTAREVQQHAKGSSSEVIQKALSGMVKIGILTQHQAGKKVFYCIAPDDPDTGEASITQRVDAMHRSVDL